jgi:hypothetical protein
MAVPTLQTRRWAGLPNIVGHHAALQKSRGLGGQGYGFPDLTVANASKPMRYNGYYSPRESMYAPTTPAYFDPRCSPQSPAR